MRGISYERFGPPEVLHYVDLPDPAPPGPGQVLVRTRAVGVNHLDHLFRDGRLGGPLPRTPGLEAAGVVEAVGPDVSAVRPGDGVFGRMGASYAELVLAIAANLFPVPDGLTFAQAATVPVAYLTAAHAVHVKCPVGAGDRVLVQAAGSSVGSAAVLLCKRLGAWVVGTAGTPGRCRRVVEELGADAAIDYSEEDVPARVRELTGGEGVDVALDGLGGATFGGTLASLAQGGRAIVYGTASGDASLTTDVGTLNERGLAIMGMSIASETRLFPRTMALFRDELLPLFGQPGGLRSLLETTLPLAQAAEAHRLIAGRQLFGKLALIPDETPRRTA